MTNNIKFLLFFLFTAILLSTCSKDPLPNYSEMWECHEQSDWDSTKIAIELIGEWKWEYVSCWDGLMSDEQSKGMTLLFKEDNSIEIKEDGKDTQTAEWSIQGTLLLTMQIIPSFLDAQGLILLCDESLVFSNSSFDGCDNYFKRK